MIGTVHGRLYVIAEAGHSPRGEKLWRCACECGSEKSVPTAKLNNGHTKSCGCLRRDRGRTTGLLQRRHGHTIGGKRSPTWYSWSSMIERCTNENFAKWHRYGGRGITVCSRWRNSFEAFLEDMGERPEGRTLDRIDPDGNYEPTNCRWATVLEQRHNRSSA